MMAKPISYSKTQDSNNWSKKLKDTIDLKKNKMVRVCYENLIENLNMEEQTENTEITATKRRLLQSCTYIQHIIP